MSAQAQPHHAAPATVESFDTIVIGGGQAGLSTGYHLSRCGVPFVILDANAHVGDSWRSHWDSMRLFTPARRDALPGMRFPAAKHAFPSGAEMAEYLEAYAERFALPVRRGVRVDALDRGADGRFLVAAGEQRFAAENVVIATGPFQAPRVPAFAREPQSRSATPADVFCLTRDFQT